MLPTKQKSTFSSMFKEMPKPALKVKYFTKKEMQIVVDQSQWFACV